MRKLLLMTALVFPLLTKAQYCPLSNNDIHLYHWSPSKGSIARYAAAILDTSTAKGTMIVLGQDSLGVYTIEAGPENDACACSYAYLAVTGFDGSRKTYLIYDGHWTEALEGADSLHQKIQERVTGQIWKFCGEKILVPARLKKIKARKDASGNISIQADKIHLQWSLSVESSMCWCFYQWVFESSH